MPLKIGKSFEIQEKFDFPLDFFGKNLYNSIYGRIYLIKSKKKGI